MTGYPIVLLIALFGHLLTVAFGAEGIDATPSDAVGGCGSHFALTTESSTPGHAACSADASCEVRRTSICATTGKQKRTLRAASKLPAVDLEKLATALVEEIDLGDIGVESDQKAPDRSPRELAMEMGKKGSVHDDGYYYDNYYDDIRSTRYGSGVCLSGPDEYLPFWCRCSCNDKLFDDDPPSYLLPYRPRCECQCIEETR